MPDQQTPVTIHCPVCGEEVQKAGMICPHCGAALSTLEHTQPLFPKLFHPRERSAQTKRQRKVIFSKSQRSVKKPPTMRRRRWMNLLLILIGLVLFVSIMAGAAYGGIYMGERDREEKRITLIQEHYDAGIAALNNGNFELAAAEFDFILQIDQNHALAQQGLLEARARLEVKPTPTSEAAQSLAEQLLEQAQTSFANEDWVATARTLTQLRALDPGFTQEEVEEMLFTSLSKAGELYLAEDNLEVGISYLDQAIALRPLDSEVIYQRNMAARYLNALNYWAVDWQLCIERFEDLVAIDPSYKDVSQRLYRAYLEYGDDFIEQGEMCPAEIQYSHALRLYVDAGVEEKRAGAAQTCLVATPVPISGTVPILTPQPIIGFTQGRLAYTVYNSSTGVYDLFALYSDGKIIKAAANADQPWWEWGTGRVAYRDKLTGGLSMVLPEEGVPLQLQTPLSSPGWPALSPDSQRIAYAAPDASGRWFIYVGDTLVGRLPGVDPDFWLIQDVMILEIAASSSIILMMICPGRG
jgi:tetratricopeptide (TPR) repeat protein